jgi:hypothetical protein
VGVLPLPAVALGLFALAGAGRSLMDVAGRTLLQRVTPDASLAGAFGVLEGLHDIMLAVGSVAAPVIIAIAGPRPALVVLGLWIPLVVLLAWRGIRTADASAVVHVRELELLRGIPMFAPLAPPMIEWLSASLVPVTVDAGAWIIRQGEVGDRFYLVEAGAVDVFIDDELVRSEDTGASFGEIALLGNVPRTASVRASGPVRLLALERGVFLAAVGGHAQSRSAAERLIRTRLGDADPRVQAVPEPAARR